MNTGVQLAIIPNVGPWELALILLIVLIIFGANKLPKIAKDLGSGIREFKKSISGEAAEEKKEEAKCVKCGAKLQAGAKFCPSCGAEQ
ncbi:MAG TPA: twin-arginine translocase TatA/TatE family subunit [Spirochaetota bacterium]|nr:twin-arginine translocase TatA/TatE family subunit [Spirochaetota bacterium]HPC42414.1 twin-arginine translocase TatA/TatE family subunit [Spirochaetota bacterium]HPL16678.1 twin-arginine translocase TatA/TatE family subunit [Spirochaetota bacterium]HQF06599.1 twin-arginine translocase TatA/TatE family subunit [Spirochaetota bacterium]HQH95998.1 twin-arginine translocase TatA/TatE family subunit [Spirochaetota bacterium]